MSDGERIPVVFYPRFTTLNFASSGPSLTHITTPMDMLGFNYLSVTCQRYKLQSASGTPTQGWTFEESSDLLAWTAILASTTQPFDPGESVVNPTIGEKQVTFTVLKRYVRLSIATSGGVDVSVTLFAIGWAARTQQ